MGPSTHTGQLTTACHSSRLDALSGPWGHLHSHEHTPLQTNKKNLTQNKNKTKNHLTDFDFPEKSLRLLINVPTLSLTFAFSFRMSLEKKDKSDKSIQWLEMHKKNCQAMSKSVTLRAKAMDPHKSLEEVFKAKLKENRSVSPVLRGAPGLSPSTSWALK